MTAMLAGYHRLQATLDGMFKDLEASETQRAALGEAARANP